MQRRAAHHARRRPTHPCVRTPATSSSSSTSTTCTCPARAAACIGVARVLLAGCLNMRALIQHPRHFQAVPRAYPRCTKQCIIPLLVRGHGAGGKVAVEGGAVKLRLTEAEGGAGRWAACVRARVRARNVCVGARRRSSLGARICMRVRACVRAWAACSWERFVPVVCRAVD
ncbi:hypothetical protein EON67_03090 [archaeon]|nr:MAG: hypothetical protein EON67_03090 [archaeon]